MLSATITPSLQIVKLDYQHGDLIQSVIKSLIRHNRSIQLHIKGSSDSGEPDVVSAIALRKPSCNLSGLQLPQLMKDVTIDLLALTHCRDLQYLNLPYPFPRFLLNFSECVKIVRYLVTGLPHLQLLCIESEGATKDRYYMSEREFTRLILKLEYIVQYSTSLRYVRVHNRAWALLPSTRTGPRLIPLDEWEAAAEIGEPDSTKFMNIFEARST